MKSRKQFFSLFGIGAYCFPLSFCPSVRVSDLVEMYVNCIDYRKIMYRLSQYILRVTDHVEMYVNVCESRIFLKNHVQIYVPKCPRTYEKLLNLLKSSIPDIFTSTLTIFSVETLEKLCQAM